MKAIEKLLSKPVDLQNLIERIAFQVEELEDAALEQPGLYLEASRYRTLKMRKRLSRELQRDMVRAEVGLKQRQKRKNGNKTTESALKELVTLSPESIGAEKNLNQILVEEEWAKALVETFRQRQKVIDVLKDIRVSESMPTIRKVRSEMAVGQMRRAAEKVRERYESEGDEE